MVESFPDEQYFSMLLVLHCTDSCNQILIGAGLLARYKSEYRKLLFIVDLLTIMILLFGLNFGLLDTVPTDRGHQNSQFASFIEC